MSKEVLKLALEALENSVDLVSHEARNAEELYGKYPSRLARIQGLVAFEVAHEQAITAIKQALEQPVPEPDWKSEYQNAVELHCMTLDELREADAWIKNLEKLMADQDAMLERQTARIVELQEHIDNFDGEDR